MAIETTPPDEALPVRPHAGALARPTPAASPIFISYSRKDYYFAESLGFELARRGVPTWLDAMDLEPGVDWEERLHAAIHAAPAVVVVASPASDSSEYVKSECAQARAEGKRIVVAWFRGRTLSGEAAGAEVVDFRGSFGRGLEELVASLGRDERAAVTEPVRSRAPVKLPPGVALVACQLLLLVALTAVAAYRGARSEGLAVVADVVGLAAPFLVWFFVVTFLLRQMSLTRLAFCFALFAFSTGYPLLGELLGDDRGYDPFDASTVRHLRVLVAAAFVLAVAGLAVVLLVRPPDLLRWTRTGHAWDAYRPAAGRVSRAVTDPLSRLEAGSGFRLLFDPNDEPAAARLREELVRRGARDAGPAGRDGTTVVLLTNRTQTAWLEAQTFLSDTDHLVVVGTAIRLPELLPWLWRRQWIDFRRWGRQAFERPGVPESLSRPRLPPEVTGAHFVMGSLGLLLFMLAGTAGDGDVVTPYAKTIFWLGLTAAVLWLLGAHRLARRADTAARISAFANRVVPLTVVAALLNAQYLAWHGVAWPRLIAALAAVAAGLLWLHRRRDDVRFWLPARSAARGEKRRALHQRAGVGLWWWVLASSLVWVEVIGSR